MQISKATPQDINSIMEIYRIAIAYMRSNGNPTQWREGYPFREIVEEDIALGRMYLLRNEANHIVAQFCYFVGDDPTYSQIDGAWLNSDSYGVVHRLASSGVKSGVGRICLDWCFAQHPNMRIDTHADNATMQKLLRECGYVECGEITVYNGTKRIAFQKIGCY